jgi:23S rRNA (uracil1939-C5)-methyltransferase
MLHLTSLKYLSHKMHMVQEAFAAHDLFPSIKPIIALGPDHRRRATIKLLQGQIGFYSQKSHKLVPIEACGVLRPPLSVLLSPLKHLGLWFKKAEISLLWTNEGCDVHISTSPHPSFSLQEIEGLTAWVEKHVIARLTINNHLFLCKHRPTIHLDGIPVSVSPKCFLQASQAMDKALKEIIEEWAGDKNMPSVVDLFCGRGTLSLPLSRFSSVTGFESDEDAVGALNQSVAQANRPLRAVVRDLYKDPLPLGELKKYDAVVLNPPRSGAPQQIKVMEGMSSKPLLYVSCAPKSLARDCALLKKQGRHILSLQPIDAFFGSRHVEVIAYIQ